MKDAKEPVQVRVQFQLTQEEYVRGMRWYLRKSHTVSWVQCLALAVVLGGAIGLSVLLRKVTFFNLLLIVLVVLLALYGAFLYVIQPGRCFRRDPALAQQVSFCFTAEDYARQDEAGAGLYDWNLGRLWRGKEFYYLFSARKDGFILLPRRAFLREEDQLAFEELAQKANPNLVFRTYG